MQTKVMRYQIIKPVDCNWNELGDVLRNIQYETRQVLNKTIQLCWEWQGFSSEYKKVNDVYPKPNDILNYSLRGFCYDKISKEFTKLHTGNLSSTLARATQKWNTDLKEIIKGDRSIANFRADVPIDLHNKSIKLIIDNNDYFVIMSLISSKYNKI
jgi:hypothetical protein